MQKPSVCVPIEIPFHDVDILGVAWHGHYYKYFEIARTALFRAHDFDIERMRELGFYMYITESRCRYIHALRYGMQVTVQATLSAWDYRLDIDYLVRDQDGKKLARGATAQVTMEAATAKLRMVTPPEILALFQVTSPQEKG